MTQSKDNGHEEEYKPSVEFEYLDSDVWLEEDKEAETRNVTYTRDVEDAVDEDDESNSNQRN